LVGYDELSSLPMRVSDGSSADGASSRVRQLIADEVAEASSSSSSSSPSSTSPSSDDNGDKEDALTRVLVAFVNLCPHNAASSSSSGSGGGGGESGGESVKGAGRLAACILSALREGQSQEGEEEEEEEEDAFWIFAALMTTLNLSPSRPSFALDSAVLQVVVVVPVVRFDA
jgi:hypothetical protein